MRPILASGANHTASKIHPALRSFADECSGLLARLIAYVGALALIAIVGLSLWDELPLKDIGDPTAKSAWSLAARSYPAFAVSQFDLSRKTETYEILRHPAGGRKDVLRWAAQGEKPIAELQIYRPGGELSQSGPPAAEIAGRMDPEGMRELQAAGIIDSKFGAVTLLGLADRGGGARPCLGFMKAFDQPDLRVSGWSCQGDTLPARRAAIGCILDRLILLTAGNDPKLAALFAHAELKRGGCAPASTAPIRSADWVTGTQNPRLRGSQ
ncbi:hypothetical protein [Bradyrhizobium sp.]|jgi:hypothetical protein|uniref:hypothetical protein n=1 Tax=Bradyrhizobium sp. TaxID=376 RepID=UPI002E0AC43D|nr:hypothetical protein [Bradyrhizobium sp.]